MRLKTRFGALPFLFSCLCLVSVPASAQDDLADDQAAMEAEADLDFSSETHETPPSHQTGLLSDEQADLEDTTPEDSTRSPLDPYEAPDEDYFFLGVNYRHMIIPAFIQNLFVDEGVTGSNPSIGLDFTWRKNDFSITVSAFYAGARANGYYRGQGDPRIDTEHINVELDIFFISAAFLWAFPVTDWFAFEVGFDLGLGVVFGDLVRTEAYESSPGAGDWQPCNGVGDPSATYCQPVANGGHYNYREPNWTEGGDVPVVFPWLALPHLAMRFKPIRQLQIRVDGGFNVYGFFLGGSAAFGF